MLYWPTWGKLSIVNRRLPVLAVFALGSLSILSCGNAPTAAPQDTAAPSDGDVQAEAAPQKYWPLTEARYGAWGDAPNAPKLGDTVEDFELPDADGGTFKLSTALAAGKPVVLVFYRGFW